MESETHEINKKLTQLARDVALIKQLLVTKASKDPEGELSDEARYEFNEARVEPATSRVRLDEMERRLHKKWAGKSS